MSKHFLGNRELGISFVAACQEDIRVRIPRNVQLQRELPVRVSISTTMLRSKLTRPREEKRIGRTAIVRRKISSGGSDSQCKLRTSIPSMAKRLIPIIKFYGHSRSRPREEIRQPKHSDACIAYAFYHIRVYITTSLAISVSPLLVIRKSKRHSRFVLSTRASAMFSVARLLQAFC